MPVTREPILLKPRIEDFLTYCLARNLSLNTVRAYRADLGDFADFISSEMTTADFGRKLLRGFVSRLHDGEPLSNKSMQRKVAVVKSFGRWLEGENLIDAGVVESIVVPRRHEELPEVPSESDVQRLFQSPIPTKSPERDRLILELLYGSGLRASELVGLDLDDFRDEDAFLVRGKGRKERMALFGEAAQAALQDWLPMRSVLLRRFKMETKAVFFSTSSRRSAERLSMRQLGKTVKRVAEERGFDPTKWHPHLLRHACGTHMHDHGAPLQAIASLLGHAKLSTAQIYTRVSMGRMMTTYRGAHPHSQGIRNSQIAQRLVLG